MADQAPPPSYEEVVKSNPLPAGFPQGPPSTAPYPYPYPYPPAGYSQGMPPTASAFTPPGQGVPGTQPPAGSSYPQYTYSTVNVGHVAHSGDRAYQFPVNQVGNTTVTAYQQPIVVSSGTFHTGAPVVDQSNRTRKRICVCACIFILVFMLLVIIFGVIF